MFPRLSFSVLLLSLLLVTCSSAYAGGNAGAEAWLSWSASGIQSDLGSPGAANNLYVRVVGAAAFKGGELDLTWNPQGDGDACAAHTGTQFKTSTACTYLNRGTTVPVTTVDAPGHLHVAWANDQTNTSCSAGGNIVVLTFEYDGCEDAHGCLSLNSLTLLDGDNVQDAATISGATATIQGGSTYCAGAQGGGGGGNAPNVPPMVASVADQEAVAGSTLTVTPSGSDTEGETLTWSGANLPAGASVNPGSGTLTWTPSATQQGSAYEGVSLVATDPEGGSGGSAFEITVGSSNPSIPLYAPSRLIVSFTAGVITPPSGSSGGTLASCTIAPSSVADLLSSAHISRLDKLFPWFTHESVHTTTVQGLPVTLPVDLTDYYIATLSDTSVMLARTQLEADTTNIRSAAPDFCIRTMTIPNDPLFASDQWWLNNTGQTDGTPGIDVHAVPAWDVVGVTPPPIKVGIIDTGIDQSHTDLGTLLPGPIPNFCPTPLNTNNDDAGHGTSCAGIVGARGNNALGVAGINWGASLVPVKIFCTGQATTQSSSAQGIDWCRTQGIPVISGSYGAYNDDSAEKAACKNAQAAGMFFAAAMGNDDVNLVSMPAGYKNFVEAVGAVSKTGARGTDEDPLYQSCSFYHFDCSIFTSTCGSDWGSWIDMAAPGWREISTTDLMSRGGFTHGTACNAAFGGTSAATPMVAGTGSLLMAMNPSLTGEDAAIILHATAKDITVPPATTGWDQYTGYGIPDARAALDYIKFPRIVQKAVASNTYDYQTVQTSIVIQCSPNLPDAAYTAERHEIRADVTFPHGFSATPDAWGCTVGSVGWSGLSPRSDCDQTAGWASIVPGTLTSTGCTLRTFVYDLQWPRTGWYPAPPSSARLAWTAIGTQATTAVGSGAGAQFDVQVGQAGVGRALSFSVTLPAAGDLSLRVFDASGRLIRTLIHGQQQAGAHQFRWNGDTGSGRKATAGVYIYHLVSSFGTRYGKVILLN
jgi:hypothetical protein